MDGIWNPLDSYRTELAERHRENTANFFDELVKRSGVNEAANAEQVKAIRNLESAIASLKRRAKCLNFFRILCIIVAVIGTVLPFMGTELNYGDKSTLISGSCILAAIASIVILFTRLNPRAKILKNELKQQDKLREEAVAVAMTQMAPLNALFTWGMVARIIQKTIPDFKFDDFCTASRCSDLEHNFDMNLNLGEDTSVVNCQSGSFNRNPFILANTLTMVMGEETYTGSLYITWREKETYLDAKGKTQTRWITKSETLVASVTKPKPNYQPDKFLIYGHEAAPNLQFSRHPTGLDADDEDWWSKFKLERKITQLEKKSRNMDGFTMVANQKFEAVFQATDRSDDQQFRLLFTPLAQKEMMELVSEDEVSFGDDFTFYKRGKINIIRAPQLANIEFAVPPSRFNSYDLGEARKKFNDFSNKYFRLFFFAFAPLLTIPLYQEERSQPLTDTLENTTDGTEASSWEFESLANYYGDGYFKHPRSVTQNILKVHAEKRDKDSSTVFVTAHGFYTVKHTDYVSKYGGDGHWHDVPVDWMEYIPVSHTTQMIVQETNKTNSDATRRFMKNVTGEGASVLFRRNILCILNSKSP